LLRVLQEKEFEPLGATKPIKTDVRILSATKHNLSKLVKKGKFRVDLFYRLDVLKIKLPALSERRDDIPLLMEHFRRKLNSQMHKSIEGFSDEVFRILLNFNYDGNIRQLENIIEHSMVMCKGEIIKAEHLPPEINSATEVKETLPKETVPLKESEKLTILKVLQKHCWNTLETSKELQIHRSTLWRKMKKYNIS
jgi:transcriptional regulator with PAS, ATPase and Fis domain